MNNKMKKRNLFVHLLRYMRGFGLYYVIGFLMMIVLVLIDLLIPYLTGLSLKILGEEVIDFTKMLKLIIFGGIFGILTSWNGFFMDINIRSNNCLKFSGA